MNFPAEIPFSQLRAVCEVLGLPAEDVKELHLDTRRLTVTLFIRDGEGRKRHIGHEPMTMRVYIPVCGEGGETGAPA